MSWPPTPSSGFQQTSTVVWGTDGIFGALIVIDFSQTVMGEEIRLSNGTGLTVDQILLNDGSSVNITVTDYGQGPPAFASVIAVNGPFFAGNMRVTAVAESAARKREGEITFTAVKFTLI